MLERLTVDDFRPLLHEGFRFAPDGQPAFDVELAEVTEVPGAPGPGGRVPFSLVFAGGPNPPLPQSIYPVEHPRMGRMDIFVVPIGPQLYEAVFT